jgi:hypothetical protein
LGSKDEILRGVYPEPKTEILRFTQDDRRGRAQDDKPAKGSERQADERLKITDTWPKRFHASRVPTPDMKV